jgi:hypothetical protein
VLIAITFVGTSLLAALALHVAWGRARSMLGHPREVLMALTVGTPVTLFVWKVGWSLALDPNAWEWWTDDRPGFKCLGLSTLLSSALLGSLVVARRGTDPVQPHVTGAAFGVASAAVAAAFTDLWCPVGAPMHVIIGHIVPMILFGVVGALVGNRILAFGR